ncbi:hypothetical protein ACYOEI_23490 [Singulisphaera rosea]
MATQTSLQRSFPTLLLILAPFRWVGKSRRRVWGVILAALATLAAPPLWWATQLVGLPDIGDPFDVRAFQAETIPDDRNAFVLYRRAVALYKPLKWSDTSASIPVDRDTVWGSSSPEVRQWGDANRESLAAYRQGAERPEALDLTLLSPYGGFVEFDAYRPFQRLLLLEASRLEQQGDMAGAWGWYRTSLRSIRHMGQYSRSSRRLAAQVWHGQLNRRVTDWADDPRTTPAQLRRALDDVIGCEQIVPSDSYSLKVEYLWLDQMLGSPDYPTDRMPPSWLRPVASYLTPERVQSISRAWCRWEREPERGRRAFRLVVANRLAFYDLPPGRRPAPEIDIPFCDLYAFGPEVSAKARALSPRSLGRWIESSRVSRELIGLFNWRRFQTKELENHRDLLILLGTQLYRRDHGVDPPHLDVLVGPYLKSLPPESLPDE